MLYIVPTPIGNLSDITLRALEILRSVDLIACEDTRTTGNLLKHFDIETARTSYHAHNEHTKAAAIVGRLERGINVALVSDAGTPGISDPGFYLVRECIRAGIEVQALPGPTAFVPALVASGLPCDRFVFEGFLPHKKGRKKRLASLADERRTIVLYESPHRIGKALSELAEHLGGTRPAAVGRELTKKFEEIRRGTLDELAHSFSDTQRVRGELVIIVGPESQ